MRTQVDILNFIKLYAKGWKRQRKTMNQMRKFTWCQDRPIDLNAKEDRDDKEEEEATDSDMFQVLLYIIKQS